MSISHYIPSHVETYNILGKRTISHIIILETSIQKSDEVYHLPMNTLQDSQMFLSGYHDPIEAWLEESCKEKFFRYGNIDLIFIVNTCKIALIFSIISNNWFQLTLMMTKFYMLVGLEMLRWLLWLYDYT